MTNADSSGLQILRVDGDFRRDLPEDVRWAATLLTAYLDGLTDGREKARTAATGPTIPDSQRPPATPPSDGQPAAASADREQLEGQATAALAAESQNPVALLPSGGICGPISGDPITETSVPDPGPSTSSSGRDVVLVWGPGAYATVRRALP
jgi:hypothetical protein